MEVTLANKMGSDLTVAEAARVSFNKKTDWEPDGTLSERDKKLIYYLVKHNHFSPLTHVQITLRLKMPIFVARQFTKHQVGFTTNEVSRRYVDEPPEFYTPDVWRKRAENKKQGSSDEVVDLTKFGAFGGKTEDGPRFSDYSLKGELDYVLMSTKKLYDRLIEADVAPEQARMVLPQSMYTEMYTTASLVGWARMYKLRTDSHAQSEITDLAKMVGDIISGIPELEHSWKALTG